MADSRHPSTARPRFDAVALHRALDARRAADGLTWTAVAREMWDQSAELNERRGDHPIVASTLTGVARRKDTSCQHALFMLRWLGADPEDFLTGPSVAPPGPLPAPGTDRRLRWHLHATARRPGPGLYEAMDERRRADGVTWAALAGELGCSANRLTGLRTARYAVAMTVAMAITQWLGRPAADFVRVAQW